MKLHPWSVTGFFATLLLFTSAVNAGEWGLAQSEPDNPISIISASAFCENYNLTGGATGPGDTSGDFGTMEPGDTFTFTATGNGTGTWRIVGDSSGDPTYTPGGTFPGTLTYEVPASGQVAAGIGFYVDSYTGAGDTISGSCGDSASALSPSAPIPSLSFWSRILVVVLIGLFGFAAFQRKRLREHR